MSDLLEIVIEAHGGLERWDQLTNVSARLIQDGVLWPLKGQAGVLDDVVVTASLHEERVSHRPFGAADRHSLFTPERVAIETGNGTVLEALDQPRASFAGHAPETAWSTLQLAYFVGTTHSTEQTLYFNDEGLLARHDYDVEISGGTSAAHYVSDYDDAAGIRLPTKHRIFPRTPDDQSLAEPLIVSIDLSEIAFT